MLVGIIGAVVAVIAVAVGVALIYQQQRRAYAKTGQGPTVRNRAFAVVILAIILGSVIVAQLVWHH